MFRSRKDGTHFPIGNKHGISEKEFENVSKDFIKVPHDHVFNKAFRNTDKKFIRLGDSFMSAIIYPKSDGYRSQADIRWSKANEKFQVYFSNHALLEKERRIGEKWFKTRQEAENFAKDFVSSF